MSAGVARNALAYWAYQAGDFALRFAVGVVLARRLGADLRGTLFATLLVSNLAVGYLNCGLQSAAMYFAAARGSDSERDALSRTHTLLAAAALAISLLAFALVAAAGETIRLRVLGGLDWGFMLAPLAALPATLYSFAGQGLLTGLGRVRRLTRILFGYSLASNLANVVLVLALPARTGTVVAALVAAWFVAETGRAIFVRRALAEAGVGFARIGPREAARGLREIFSFGLRAHAAGAAGIVLGKNDQTFVASRGHAAVGSYSISVRLAELLYYPSAALETGAYARVASLPEPDSARLVRDLFRTNFLLSALPMAGLFLLADPFVRFVYGEEYADAIEPLRILLPGTMAFALSRMPSLYFSARLGRPQIPAAIGWIGAAINLPAMYWAVVVADRGLVGAAWVATACYVLILAILWGMFAAATGLRDPRAYLLPNAADLARLRGILPRRTTSARPPPDPNP